MVAHTRQAVAAAHLQPCRNWWHFLSLKQYFRYLAVAGGDNGHGIVQCTADVSIEKPFFGALLAVRSGPTAYVDV